MKEELPVVKTAPITRSDNKLHKNYNKFFIRVKVN
jgi:hypothetical protein